MGLKLVLSQWSHNVITQSFPPQKTPISSIASTKSSKKKDPIPRIFLSSSNIWKKSQSFHIHISRGYTIKRACSENLDKVSDDFSAEYIKGLAQSFELSGDQVIGEQNSKTNLICTLSESSFSASEHRSTMSRLDYLEPLMLRIRPEPPDWPEREEILRASIERKANRIEIPLSLRMIKKKQQRQEGFRDVGDSDNCSVKNAFSSMEFIIIELQSYALQMREVLCHEDLEGIIAKVQQEMHISFVWLFQQVFSRTPALMINVMILLSNFSLYSTALNIDSVEPSIMGSVHETRMEAAATDKQNRQYSTSGSSIEFVSFAEHSFEDGNRHLSRSSPSQDYPNSVPDHKISQEFGSVGETKLWNSIVDEVKKMQVASLGDFVPDHGEMQWFVSPVTVELEPDDYVDYFRTDLMYQMGLSQEPNNSLLLCNYAQFLYLVVHDYDRAEECFRRAIQVEPPDAESVSQYANFLWRARKDLWGAEERYLQALAAEPDNPYHASRYANFLWNTGGEETCFPPDTSQNNSKASNL